MSVAYRRRKKIIKRKRWNFIAHARRQAARKSIPPAIMTQRILSHITEGHKHG